MRSDVGKCLYRLWNRGFGVKSIQGKCIKNILIEKCFIKIV